MRSVSGTGPAGDRPEASGARVPAGFRRWGPLLMAAAILLALVFFSDLEMSDVERALGRVSLSAILLVLALTAAQTGLSTIKWLIALRASAARRTDASTPTIANAYQATVLGSLLAHILPVHVSTVLTRTAALAAEGGRREIGRGAATSVYEQGFDALVAVLLAPAGVVYLLGGGAAASLAILGISLLVGSAASIAFAPRLVAALADRLQASPRARAKRAAEVLLTIRGSGLLRSTVLAATFALALLRYACLVGRLGVVWWILLPELPAATFLAVAATIQGALIVAITPGGLGLTEAGWTGLLAMFRIPLDDAVIFTLAVRITLLVSLVVLAGAVASLTLATGRRQKSTGSTPPCQIARDLNG